MAGFIGKWKTDITSYQNFDAYCKASGLEDKEFIEKLRTAVSVADFRKNDDGTWTCRYTSDLEKGEKVITFTPGQETETTFMNMKFKKHKIDDIEMVVRLQRVNE